MKGRYHSFAFALALPLAFALWQNSSCSSSSNSHTTNSTMNVNANSSSNQRDVRGQWGGLHISMEVTEAGAQLTFDCAHGRITEKIAADRDGKFEAKGVFTRERPGPTREGENNEQPALYRGLIKDNVMTLEIEMTGDKESLGTFTLTHGNAGRIRRCM